MTDVSYIGGICERGIHDDAVEAAQILGSEIEEIATFDPIGEFGLAQQLDELGVDLHGAEIQARGLQARCAQQVAGACAGLEQVAGSGKGCPLDDLLGELGRRGEELRRRYRDDEGRGDGRGRTAQPSTAGLTIKES